MPEGTPIVAARSGIVVSSRSRMADHWMTPRKEGRNPSNNMIIRHDDGQESFYAHLARHSVLHPVGTRVSMGEVIARSGQTGYATYPHLHFGVFDAEGHNIRIPWIEALTVPFLRIYRTRT